MFVYLIWSCKSYLSYMIQGGLQQSKLKAENKTIKKQTNWKESD